MRRLYFLIVVLSTLLGNAVCAVCQHSDGATVAATSPQMLDSRGEMVYSYNRDNVKAQAITPTTLLRAPELPVDGTFSAEVWVSGVVAQNGDFIDLKIMRSNDPAASALALKQAAGYKFRPAKRSGKPIAVSLSMLVQIHS